MRASREIFTPGYIIPPRCSPSSFIAQKVVAVPISMTIIGFGYCAIAATAPTPLSLPSCAGLSSFILRPVFIPGPTTKGS